MSSQPLNVKIVSGPCPYNSGGLGFQDPAPIHQCVFVPSNLHTAASRQEALSLVAAVEQGCGSCSNVILHEQPDGVEVIWSGCGNVRGPIIDRALEGLPVRNLPLMTEHQRSAHVLLVEQASLANVKGRFEAVYSS